MRVFNIEKPERCDAQLTVAMPRAVNFGVVYGISGAQLSNNLGISRKEAKAYIETYFEHTGHQGLYGESGAGSA